MATSDSDIDARGKRVNIEDNDDTESRANIAEDGGLVVDGDVSDSAVNSGVVQGVLAGDDADVKGLIVGDENIQLDDVRADAFALGGNATDANVDVDGAVNGNFNLALGEDINQSAEQDNSQELEVEFDRSFNEDNSETLEALVDVDESLAEIDLDV